MTTDFAEYYVITVPTQEAARSVADDLAARGHRLVAIRIVDHFHFDPSSFWYGKPSVRPQLADWWDVFSLVVRPAASREARRVERIERRAVDTIARAYGGEARGPGGAHVEMALRSFSRVGLVYELSEEQAAELRRTILASP